MNERQLVWAQVYASILGGLCANTEIRLSWPDLRARARIETDFAMNVASGFNG